MGKGSYTSIKFNEILGNVKKELDEQEEDEADFNVLEVAMSHDD